MPLLITLLVFTFVLPSLVAITVWWLSPRFQRFESFVFAMVVSVVLAVFINIGMTIAMGQVLEYNSLLAFPYIGLTFATAGTSISLSCDVYGKRFKPRLSEKIAQVTNIRRGA